MKLVLAAAVVVAIAAVAAFFISGQLVKGGAQDYVAHGGGAIDGYTVTNSLEAVENALSKGVKYIELDLQQTSDGKLVATHDWSTFRMQTGADLVGDIPMSFDEFRRALIYERFTPLTADMIDSLFAVHKDAFLVADKMDDAELIVASFPNIRERIVVECFSTASYKRCSDAGLKVMRSFHNFIPNGVNVVGERGERYCYLHLLPTRFAVFPQKRISVADADSMFDADARIRFVYVDFIE